MSEYLEVHASTLMSFLDCQRAAATVFLKKDIKDEGYELAPSRNSISAAIGRSVHAMGAEVFMQKLSGFEPNIEAAFAARKEAFELSLTGEVIWDNTTPHIQTAEKQLKAISAAMLPIFQNTTPQNVEDELSFIVSPLGEQAVPIRLVGTRDLRDIRDEIHDHKTGSEMPSPYAQLGAYALLTEWNGQRVSGVRMNYAPRLGINHLNDIKVRSIRFDLADCKSQAWSALKSLQWAFENWLESKDPYEFNANNKSQNCTEKYCTAFNTGWCAVGKCK